MTQWEYCEVDFDGAVTWVYFYDEAGDYIDSPTKHARLGLMLAKLGHDGWEIISSRVYSRFCKSYSYKGKEVKG